MKPALASFAVASALLTGCGAAAPGCIGKSYLNISPSLGTADSSAKAPGNQQQFTAAVGETFSSPYSTCAVPANEQLVHPVWTNPDPLHISISSADDSTNGLATCKGPTSSPITLTATLTATSGSGTAAALTATASLTCQ